MESGTFKAIELLLIVGLVFGFGFWQLASLRRDRGRSDHAGRSDKGESKPSADRQEQRQSHE